MSPAAARRAEPRRAESRPTAPRPLAVRRVTAGRPGRPGGRPAPRRPIGPRLALATGGAVLVLAAFVGRLAQLQIVSPARFGAHDRRLLLRQASIPVLRGAILDREGGVLAMSLARSDVIADPLLLDRAEVVVAAHRLAPILGRPVSWLTARLSERSGYVPLAADVGEATARAIEAIQADPSRQIPGITLEPVSERFAPNGSLATPLLGFLGANGAGAAGIEYLWNRVLAGHPGAEVSEVAGLNGLGTIPGSTRVRRSAVPGEDVQLTLDLPLQYDTEQALAAEIRRAHAKAGWAIVESSRTGQILAMSSLSAEPGGRVVPAASDLPVSYTYEPGSVMKLTTFSGALARHLITPTTVFTVPPDLVIDGSVFHDAEPHGTLRLSATEIIAQSSNIGTIEIAERLGAEGVYSYQRAFGFGRPAPIDLPGQSPGILRPPSTWSPTAIGSTPIGQDTGVTALQVLDAYNTLANGGVAVSPEVVLGVRTPSGRLVDRPTPRRHRVIPAWVAKELTGMLEHVVGPAGTAPAAAIPGYAVAGKTGTAQKPRPHAPGYQPGAYMATFVGFAPAANPAITAIVVLDRPTPIYGGSVAAPVFAVVVRDALELLGVPPAGLGPAATEKVLRPGSPADLPGAGG
jgi:cell division protein FtsI (penicillin-binding protein 3)